MTLPNTQRIGDVDWLATGDFTAEERGLITDWYSKFHGEGDLELAAFVPFWLEFDQPTFRRYRRWAVAAVAGDVPSSAGSLLQLHHYVVSGWQHGARYEAVGAREWGVSRAQVIETISLAFLHAGPMGMTPSALATREVLREWPADHTGDPSVWPSGWSADPAVFQSGVDMSQTGLSDDEVTRLEQWYLDNQGEVPEYVPVLARYCPEALKAFRSRYEGATVTLPKQMVPLCTFYTAAITGRQSAMRRAAFQARRYGVTRNQIVQVVARAILYAGDLGMAEVAAATGPILDAWND